MMEDLRFHVLEKVGLQPKIIWKDSEPYAFDDTFFTVYSPKEYLADRERRERDEVFGFADIVVLHKSTGLRVKFSVYENYFGDEVEYKAQTVFIIQKDGKRLDVVDMEPGTGCFSTARGMVHFSEVKKVRDPND